MDLVTKHCILIGIMTFCAYLSVGAAVTICRYGIDTRLRDAWLSYLLWPFVPLGRSLRWLWRSLTAPKPPNHHV